LSTARVVGVQLAGPKWSPWRQVSTPPCRWAMRRVPRV